MLLLVGPLLMSQSVVVAQDVVKAPFEISQGGYIPSGYMGDGEQGRRYVTVRPSECDVPRPILGIPICYEVSYSPGSRGWAGVYWQWPANNWGEKPGKRVLGATRVSFWARGIRGGEIVEFKAGGISGKVTHDSFESTVGSVVLSKEWQRFEIALQGRDLSNVIGAFAWVATADGNPGGAVFYIARITYE
jgi:hypothetical protein